MLSTDKYQKFVFSNPDGGSSATGSPSVTNMYADFNSTVAGMYSTKTTEQAGDVKTEQEENKDKVSSAPVGYMGTFLTAIENELKIDNLDAIAANATLALNGLMAEAEQTSQNDLNEAEKTALKANSLKTEEGSKSVYRRRIVACKDTFDKKKEKDKPTTPEEGKEKEGIVEQTGEGLPDVEVEGEDFAPSTKEERKAEMKSFLDEAYEFDDGSTFEGSSRRKTNLEESLGATYVKEFSGITTEDTSSIGDGTSTVGRGSEDDYSFGGY